LNNLVEKKLDKTVSTDRGFISAVVLALPKYTKTSKSI